MQGEPDAGAVHRVRCAARTGVVLRNGRAFRRRDQRRLGENYLAEPGCKVDRHRSQAGLCHQQVGLPVTVEIDAANRKCGTRQHHLRQRREFRSWLPRKDKDMVAGRDGQVRYSVTRHIAHKESGRSESDRDVASTEPPSPRDRKKRTARPSFVAVARSRLPSPSASAANRRV